MSQERRRRLLRRRDRDGGGGGGRSPRHAQLSARCGALRENLLREARGA
jgi:hypothetical protein